MRLRTIRKSHKNRFGVTYKPAQNAVLDGIMIIVVLVLFAIFSVIGLNVLEDVNGDMNSTGMSEESVEVTKDLRNKYPALIDNLFLFAFVLIVVFVLGTVFLLDTHPIFFVISVILLVSVFLVSALLANAYDDLMSDGELSVSAELFPKMSWITSHLLELSIGVSFLVLLALFAKLKGGGG